MKVTDITNRTSRTDFNESWLNESPEGIEPTETYSVLLSDIKDYINSGIEPSAIAGTPIKKIDLASVVYYWIENKNQILAAVSLTKRPQNLTVTLSGKNPSVSRQAPYLSELYVVALQDSGLPILMSDTRLSDSGKKIWRNLISSGHTVTIYDSGNPAQERLVIKSPDELDKFWRLNDKSARRYQYVLSENGKMTIEVAAHFNTYKNRLLTGLGVED